MRSQSHQSSICDLNRTEAQHGSLGIACDFENGSVYIQEILPNSQLMNHANVGEFVHQINQTLVQYQEDLKTDSDSNLRIITMRKQVPQESQATEEVSLTFIQDGADPFEDEKTRQTRSPADFKYSCTSPLFYLL